MRFFLSVCLSYFVFIHFEYTPFALLLNRNLCRCCADGMREYCWKWNARVSYIRSSSSRTISGSFWCECVVYAWRQQTEREDETIKKKKYFQTKLDLWCYLFTLCVCDMDLIVFKYTNMTTHNTHIPLMSDSWRVVAFTTIIRILHAQRRRWIRGIHEFTLQWAAYIYYAHSCDANYWISECLVAISRYMWPACSCGWMGERVFVLAVLFGSKPAA